MHLFQTPARSFSPWPMSVCVCMRDSEIGCQRHITHPIGRDARLKNKGKLPVLLFGNAHAWTHLAHAHARDASLLCMCLCVCVWDNVQRARENCMRSNRNKKEKKNAGITIVHHQRRLWLRFTMHHLRCVCARTHTLTQTASVHQQDCVFRHLFGFW